MIEKLIEKYKQNALHFKSTTSHYYSDFFGTHRVDNIRVLIYEEILQDLEELKQSIINKPSVHLDINKKDTEFIELNYLIGVDTNE